MRIRFETHRALPCRPSVFVVNGIQADTDDFGEQDSHSDGYYGCISNTFKPFRHPPKNVLNKCKISLEEFLDIGDILQEKLDIHNCGWCK